MTDSTAVALSLVSHTNAGKTTLARTLLGRDIGEVRDAAHVTTEATPHLLIASTAGDGLMLWDTPGFGDSVRLARRLRQLGNPIGWFLAQVWDRYRDRAFWLTQQAVRNVHDHADVVLYLVNAAEEPGDAGYLEPELEVLEWIGKPVLVLLNQTGRPRPRPEEAADELRWRDALKGAAAVSGVLTLDAFARCWVQELTLFAAVEHMLPPEKTRGFGRLVDAWWGHRLEQFDESMAALAHPIARAACDQFSLPAEPFTGWLGKPLNLNRILHKEAATKASREMGDRLGADLRAAVDRLISVHDLDGRAAGVLLERLSDDLRTDAPMDEGKAAVVGGVVSGALTGLAADLAAGGLTFGAGLLTGAVLGALGGAGMARGVNVVRGQTEAHVRWDDAFLDGLVTAALLRYLAVAHYGRGRGEWQEGEHPAFWRETVVRGVVAEESRLRRIWEQRTASDSCGRMERELHEALADMAWALLRELFPDTLPQRRGETAERPALARLRRPS